MDTNKDYYKILGVSPSVEPEALKAVFRALAKKYHPVTTSEPSTSQKFRDVQEAYDVLSDPELREIYNREKSGDEDEEEGESRIGLIIAAVAGGLLLVTLAVFLLMSQQIASWIPGMSSVYESIELNKKILGEGLRIPDNKLQSERIPGKDSETLIVRGVIRNITKEQLALPMVRLSLFNGEGKVVQTKVIKPRAPVLAGNKSIGFEIKMKDPAATARRIEVTFAETPKG